MKVKKYHQAYYEICLEGAEHVHWEHKTLRGMILSEVVKLMFKKKREITSLVADSKQVKVYFGELLELKISTSLCLGLFVHVSSTNKELLAEVVRAIDGVLNRISQKTK